MAITSTGKHDYVSNTTGGTTTPGLALTGLTGGNLLVAAVTTIAGATPSQVNTTVGTAVTWTKLPTAMNGNAGVALFYGLVPSDGDYTFTGQCSTADAPTLIVSEYTGNKGTLVQVVDTSGTATGTGTSPSASTGGDTYDDDLLVAALTWETSVPTISSTDVSIRENYNNTAISAAAVLGDKAVSTSGVQSGAFSSTGSIAWAVAVATFRAAAAPDIPRVVYSKTNSASSATPTTGTLATAPTAGNLQVVMIAAKSDYLATGNSLTWDQTEAVNSGGNNLGITLLTRTATGSEGTTAETFTLTGAVYYALAYFEITAWDSVETNTPTIASNTTSTTTPALDPSADNALVLGYFGKTSGAGSSATNGGTPETDWSELADVANSTATTRPRIYVESYQQTTHASDTATVTWLTTTAAYSGGGLIAILPAASGPAEADLGTVTANGGASASATVGATPLIAATADGAGTAAGTLSAPQRLAGQADGAGTATAPVISRALLAAQADGAGTATAAVLSQVLLTAGADGAGTAAAALVSRWLLTAQADGAGTAAAGLIARALLPFTADGTGAATATLDAGAVIEANLGTVASNSAGTATALLGSRILLTAEADGAATAAASLVSRALLPFAADGAGTAAALLESGAVVEADLGAALAAGAAMAAAGLISPILLAAAANGAATAAGLVAAQVTLAASADGVSVAAGSLGGAVPLDPHVDGMATALALLASPTRLIATAAGSGTAMASIVARALLAATAAAGGSTAAATLIAWAPLAATANGAGTLAAVVMSRVLLVMTANGAATADMRFTDPAALIARSDGAGALTVWVLVMPDLVGPFTTLLATANDSRTALTTANRSATLLTTANDTEMVLT